MGVSSMKRILFALLNFCVAGSTWAACTGSSPTWNSSLDYTSLNACVSAASSGDTINVASGSATYSSTINITKPLKIIGAGDTTSVINASGVVVFHIRLSSGAARIAGFGFTGSGGSTGLESSIIQVSGVENSTIFDSVRLDHLRFTSIGSWSIYVGEWWDIPAHPPKMLVDHITGVTLTNSFMKIAGNNNTWKLDDQYGTDFAVYLEDSTLAWTDNGAVTDTEYGVRFVVRYNTITNGSVQMHDTGSTQGAKGNRIAEIYNNVFNCTSGSCGSLPAMGLRGGGYIVYGNTISTNFGMTAWPQIWRQNVGAGFLGQMCNGTPISACDTPHYYHCSGGDHRACSFPGDSVCSGIGSCVITATSSASCPTGTSFIANLDRVNGGSDASGWPCRNQTGWGKESADGSTQSPSPVYWYNNVNQNGATITFPNPQPTVFQQDRDFCYHSPATTCGAKSAWTYTPYTYPHALQGTTGAPSVSFVTPTNGSTITCLCSVSTTASDDGGAGNITQRLTIDGKLRAVATGATLSYRRRLTPGLHTLSITATDAQSNATTVTITITVI